MSQIYIDNNYFLRGTGVEILGSTDQITWNSLTFPVIINTNTAAIINCLNSLTFDDTNQYFIIGNITESLILDGGNNSHNILATNWLGLVQNGTSNTSGYSNVTIQNFNIHSSSATLSQGSGWICQSYYSNNCITSILNCNSDGPISSNSGGICGSYVGCNGGQCSITNCYSMGIIDSYAGGICGIYSADNFGACIINDCYSVGNIGECAGGICGAYAKAGYIQGCYSVGNINLQGGGIMASNSQNYTINSCYSLGTINTNAGGIIGTNNTDSTLDNCYTCGLGTADNGIIGTDDTVIEINNCYSETYNHISGWNSLNADNLSGDNWCKINNIPWLISAFNTNPYSSANDTVEIGNKLINTLIPNIYSQFKIISDSPGITIDNNGVISTSNEAAVGINTITILNYDNFLNNVYYPYNIYPFIFTITAVTTPPISNNTNFNNLVNLTNNIFILTDDFTTDTLLSIYLPKGYIFNGDGYTITINTPNNTTLFQLQKNKNNPNNKNTIIQNLNLLGANFITHEKNVILTNCSSKQLNSLISIPFIGDDCKYINIYNSRYTGIGSFIGDNCKDISLVSNIIITKLINSKTAAITGKKCKLINIENCQINVNICAEYCSSIIGYKNIEISVSKCIAYINLHSIHAAAFVCSKSTDISLFKCSAKVKSHHPFIGQYYLHPASNISIEKSYIKE